jgi:hypothetical protein
MNGYGRGNGYGYGRGRDRDRDRDHGNNGNGNGNGNYGYGRGNGNGYGAPAGSYQQSCTSVQMHGSMLTATCPAGNGSPITSTLDASQCRGADIANMNGRLQCR